jgi:RNA polymerase sigma-70 factor (ECF subfamily)
MADVFGVPYGDIATVVDKSPEACRQIASRARRRLRHPSRRPSPGDRSVVNGLLVALWLGDMDAVLSRLAPEVVCVSDGGATRSAARRPVVGAHRVGRFLVNLVKRFGDEMAVFEAVVNGERGLIGRVNGEVDFVAAFEVTDGVVSNVRLVNNPDKLRQVESRPNLV